MLEYIIEWRIEHIIIKDQGAQEAASKGGQQQQGQFFGGNFKINPEERRVSPSIKMDVLYHVIYLFTIHSTYNI